MSYEYFARPVVFSGPSTRLTRVPSTRDFSGHAYFGWLAGRAGAWTSGTWSSATSHPFRLERRRKDADVRAAAADVAVEGALGLLGCWIRSLLQQGNGRHYESRRAESAHQTVVVAVGLLHRVKRTARSQSFDGADVAALR